MSKRIRIRPGARTKALEDVLGDLISGKSVKLVCIDTQTRTVTLSIDCTDQPEQGFAAAVQTALAQCLGVRKDSIRVLWQPSANVGIEALVDANRHAIISSLAEQLPALKGCLGAIEFVCQAEQSVSVLLPGQIHAARAARKQFRDSVQQTLSECCGKKIMVRVMQSEATVEPEPDEPVAFVAEEELERAAKTLVLLGRRITESATPVCQVVSEGRGQVVWGRIFSLEQRNLRNGSVLNSFNLTDGTDSLAVKAITKGALDLKEGLWVRVRGDMAPDKYADDLVLSAKDIVMDEAPQPRRDDAAEKRVELHLHTKMSSMDAVLEIEDALCLLKEWGHRAVAITDHGVVQAFPQASEAARRLGIKLVYGVEGYLVESDSKTETPYHVVLLARNIKGLKQVYKLVSTSHLEHFYKRPRMLRQDIENNRSDLFVGSACEAGEIYRAVAGGASEEKLLRMAEFYDYLEIQPVANNMFLTEGGKFTEDDLLGFNKRIYDIGKRLEKPVVAAGDVHFLHPEDAIYRRVLLGAQGFEDAEKDTPLYLRTTDEMLDAFAFLGKEAAYEVVVQTPNELVSRVESFDLLPEGFCAPNIEGADSDIDGVVRKEAARLYGKPMPEPVKDRLEKELDAIVSGGFSGIYSICRKLVQKSLKDGFLVGSRGSVGSSFVAWLYGVTEVNPLEPHYLCPKCRFSDFGFSSLYDSGFDLPSRQCPECGHELRRDGQKIAFEVFMGFEGDKVPDIDLNFSGENQAAVIKYAERLLGQGNVFRAGTIATIADRTAFGLVKAYVETTGANPRKAEMARLAHGITGVKRTTGRHPGGVLVVPEHLDILDFTPIQHPADDRKSGTVTTHFDYNAISNQLLKIDILGHDDPTALRMLHEYTGIDPARIPLSDPQTMSIFSSTDALGYAPEDIGCPVGTIAIPEFGTRFVRQMLSEAKPGDFSGLVRISGLSHGTDVWLNNAQDIIRKNIAPLSEIICARDDIFHYLSSRGVPAERAFRIMEAVRKGRGVPDEDVAAMRDAGVPDWYIASCQRIKYLFPKAHAVAYVLMAFRIAYFKVHHPEAFYAQYLSLRTDDIDLAVVLQGPARVSAKLGEIENKGNEATPKERDQAVVLEAVSEMFLRGIKLAPLSLYASDATRFTISENGLLPPLSAVPGMGKAAVRNLEKARKAGPFLSVEDLRTRARLQRNLIELLREMGCLGDMPEHNQIALF